MKKVTMIVLAVVLGLSVNGVIFGKGGLMVSDRSATTARGGLLITDRSNSQGGLMVSDRSAENQTACSEDESSSFVGILMSDFYNWFTGETDEKGCE